MEGYTPAKDQGEGLEFKPDKMVLLLHVIPKQEDIDAMKTIARQEGLQEKAEFHSTLIGSDTGEAIAELLSALTPEEKEQKTTSIQKLCKEYSWVYVPRPEYYVVTKDYGDEVRRTLVQLIDLPDMKVFYQNLNALLGTDFSLPLPHITLFSSSTNDENMLRGIGLYSKEQFRTLNPKRVYPNE